MIRYEYERDVLPLVLSNCQYMMERGQETLAEYDLPKIQQQILTRFLQGKPHITLNVRHSTTIIEKCLFKCVFRSSLGLTTN